jgi:hypothetical protein
MQRWISVLLGLGVLVVAAWITANGLPARHHAVAASGDANAPAGSASSEPGGALAVADAGASGAEAAAPPAQVDVGGRVGAGMRMPDGTLVPPLPDKPARVHFGVVLVTYAGAQGAPEHARSAHEARDIANKLAVDAKTDFHGAVVRGDSGSIDDAGSMPRGVLEPAVEYVLFTLPVGGVSDPLDTPRGYWIVKRTE